MKCFEHAKNGEMMDAVAVCTNCGVALCQDHLVEDINPTARTNQLTRRILCHVCAEGRETTDAEIPLSHTQARAQ